MPPKTSIPFPSFLIARAEEVEQHDDQADGPGRDRDVRQEPRAHQSGRNGRRTATSCTVSSPKTKPPMCAKNATPPPACGWTIEKPPSHSWNRNQTPRNRIAGISWKKMKKKMNAVSTLAFGRSTK